MAHRVCVVGVGRWGTRHALTLNDLGHLAGLIDSEAAARRQASESFPGIPVFESVTDAMEAGMDAFVVATPPVTHYQLGRHILEAGRHALIEKPLALRSMEARQLVELARDRGLCLMVGHVLLFHPAIRYMREHIRSGDIGKLQYLYSNRLNLGTVRTEENILWSFAPHDISIFQYFIGERPVAVVSRGSTFLQPGIHDTTLTLLRYPDNISGHIFVSWLHPFKEHRLVVVGDRGMFVFEDGADGGSLLYYEKSIDWIRGKPIPREGPTEVIELDRKAPLTAELECFIRALDGTAPDTADGASAIEVLEILEEATSGLEMEMTPHARHSEHHNCFIHPSACVDDDVSIGEGTKVWHYSHIQGGAKIGHGCTLGQNVYIGANVKLGDGCKIQNNVSIYEGVELENHVFCGPSMTFTNILDPRCKYPQRGTEHYLRTLVREGATIGANATIVCGHTLGRHCFIAAGAVVTKDVPDYALMAGVPATRIGWVCECGERLARRAKQVSCRRCGLAYRVERGRLTSAQTRSSSSVRGKKSTRNVKPTKRKSTK